MRSRIFFAFPIFGFGVIFGAIWMVIPISILLLLLRARAKGLG